MLPHDRNATAAPFAPEGGTRRDDASASAARLAGRADPSRVQDAALVAHIVEHHHAYARRALPYVVALLAKISGFHRRRNAKLAALCDAGHELADTLEGHLDDEERDLFPALLAGAPTRDAARRELDRTSRHHRQLGLLLARTRWLADDFAVPAWGGRSYQALMEELESLEENVLEYMHVESFVLLPRLSSRCAEVC
jgi:regulator of cell morphogenesis and NO signaling